jgi:hypothetical protein
MPSAAPVFALGEQENLTLLDIQYELAILKTIYILSPGGGTLEQLRKQVVSINPKLPKN